MADNVMIDGKAYPLPVMKFKQLKQAFPLIEQVQGATDPMEMASAAIAVVSIAMSREHPEMTPEWLEENMTILETKELGAVMMGIMIQSGLVTEGDAKVALSGEDQGANLSTETLTPSSQNSSQPDAPVETGTA